MKTVSGMVETWDLRGVIEERYWRERLCLFVAGAPLCVEFTV
jgi:hypothetical protein